MTTKAYLPSYFKHHLQRTGNAAVNVAVGQRPCHVGLAIAVAKLLRDAGKEHEWVADVLKVWTSGCYFVGM